MEITTQSSLVTLAHKVIVVKNKLVNQQTGHSIKIDGSDSELLVRKLLSGATMSNFIKLFGDQVTTGIDNLYKQGYVLIDGKSSGEESSASELTVNNINSFFGVPAGNLSYDIDNAKHNTIGMMGIDSFSGSLYHTISSESVDAIRTASTALYTFETNDKGQTIAGWLHDKRIVDYGNLSKSINQERMEKRIMELGAETLSSNSITPFFIGSDHLLTYYLLKGYLTHNPKQNMQIIQFDAHKDTGYSRWGMPEHGSFIRELSSERQIRRIIQVGVRGIHSDGESSSLANKVEECTMRGLFPHLITGTPVYITTDVDCLDPSIMEAVSYPVNGGLHISDFDEMVAKMGSKNIIGLDLVEYNKDYDSKNLRSASTAAELLLRELSMVGGKK